jgi:hypothetical protein
MFATLFEEDIVDGNDTAWMIFCVIELLEPLESRFVHGLFVPIDFVEKAIQARLIGGVWHFGGHTGNGFVGCPVHAIAIIKPVV